MADTYVDAGSLSERLELLELQQTAEQTWEWVSAGRLWAQVEVDGGRNLFSAVGIGARNAKLVLRTQALTLHQALRWKGQHLFLTSITKLDRMHLSVQAALVSVDTITLQEDADTGNMTFPGVLTEKYARHEQEWPMSINQLGLVLVTPKAVTLKPGSLVKARGSFWEVLVPHELDEYKNEYEIGRTVDL